jgi:hypothetical protein
LTAYVATLTTKTKTPRARAKTKTPRLDAAEEALATELGIELEH